MIIRPQTLPVSIDSGRGTITFSNGMFPTSRKLLVQAIKEWREEWDLSPNQFLQGEAFRQSDPQAYAEEVADLLMKKLLSQPKEGGAA